MPADLHELLARLTAPAPPLAVTFDGTYDMTIAAMFMNQSVLASALPDRLELRPDASTPAGMHPLIVTFGVQHDVGGGFLPRSTYLESAVGIPNVGIRGSGSNDLSVYMTRLDVNNAIALALGLSIGYPKFLSVINGSAQQFEVLTPLKREIILQGAMTPTTAWKTLADFPLFQYVQGLLANPLISVDAAGSLVYSVYRWGFAAARFQGATARLNVTGDVSGLPRNTYTFQSFETTSMGAAHLSVLWTLSGPYFDRP